MSKKKIEFTYETWGGSKKTVHADLVAFMPSHVVFTDQVGPDTIVVLAEQNSNVNRLHSEVVEVGE